MRLFCNNIINILTMQKAIYVGAGTDILPLLCYPNIKEWIYIDSQPNNEFGPKYVKEFSRPYFINEFINKFFMFEFEINSVSYKKEFIEFINFKTDQRIKYYFNTYLPDKIDKVKDVIKEWDTLIVAGHHPDSCIMDYKKRDYHSTFIGFTQTVYRNEDHDNHNNIVAQIFNGKYKFDTYLYNTSPNWWYLYSELEDTVRDSKTFDSKYDFLPGTLINLNYSIINKIKQIYNSTDFASNNFEYDSWNQFQEMLY